MEDKTDEGSHSAHRRYGAKAELDLVGHVSRHMEHRVNQMCPYPGRKVQMNDLVDAFDASLGRITASKTWQLPPQP